MAQQPNQIFPIPQPIYSRNGSASPYSAAGSGGPSAQFQYIATYNQPHYGYPHNQTSFNSAPGPYPATGSEGRSAQYEYIPMDNVPQHQGHPNGVTPFVGTSGGRQQDLPYRPARKRTKQWRSLVLFDGKTELRSISKPFWRYMLPEQLYPKVPKYHHTDPVGRETYYRQSDRYTRSWDAKLRNLYVQSTDEVRDNAPPASSTWRRTHIRDVGPLSLRLASWIMDGSTNDAGAVGKYVFGSIALMFTIVWSMPVGMGQIRNHGHYETLPYNYWHYMRTYRNMKENHKDVATNHWSAIESRRALRPMKLCVLTEGGNPGTAHTVEDTEGLPPINYLFIAYTSHHFHGPEGKRRLLEIAESATRNAGLAAFWVGMECLPGVVEQGFHPEIHLINDIIRCCTGLVIALPEPTPEINREEPWKELLTQWGKRMWTFPEALLSPGNEIPVYVYGDPDGLDEPTHIIPKAQFAEYAWEDAYEARQLMDHFLGNLILTRLEFAKMAIQCLLKRARMDEARDGSDSRLLLGDMAYCYSGLLRRRPLVNGQDTEFEAFAKLDFANDSDQLFERLVCLLPKKNDHWFTNNDAWGAELHDIQPTCQVAAVDTHSVLLDGCHGATIRWKKFMRVAYINFFGVGRIFPLILLRLNLFYFSISLLFVCLKFSWAIFFFLPSIVLMFAKPWLVQKLYSGKVWDSQGWFFGFEGYMDIKTIEMMIFGSYEKRLKWSVAGSIISAHEKDKSGKCIGIDPIDDEEVRAQVRKAARSGMGEEKIFTLVDTYTLTVTLFSAVRPPTAVLICGVEGGMQRAVLCSYDWSSGTLYRETVLRMDTRVLNRMDRTSRVKFGFCRPDSQDVNINIDNPSSHQSQ